MSGVNIGPRRVDLLSALKDTIETNLAATSGNTVDLSTVTVTVLPAGDVADSNPERVYLGIPSAVETQATTVGSRHLEDVWQLTALIRSQPPGGAEAETQWLATLGRCEAIAGAVLASVHGDGRVTTTYGTPRVSGFDGPTIVGGSPLIAEALVTVTVTSTIHPAIPSS